MTSSKPKTETIEIRLELPEADIEAEMEIPAGPMRLAELAFTVLGISNAVSDLAEKGAAKFGHRVSCSKGCAACCRHLVPVSAAEAFMLAELVEDMPEPRRSALKERFKRNEVAMAKFGFLDRLEELHGPDLDEAGQREIAKEYLSLWIDCPFLEDETCSIHADRPAICREFSVTSAPENCWDPFNLPSTRLPVSVNLTEALAEVSSKLLGKPLGAIPLPLALGWAEEHREMSRRAAPGRRLVNELIKHLNEKAAKETSPGTGQSDGEARP